MILHNNSGGEIIYYILLRPNVSRSMRNVTKCDPNAIYLLCCSTSSAKLFLSRVGFLSALSSKYHIYIGCLRV